MYAGHVGLALALRSARGAPPLWLLVVAAQGPDWHDAMLDLSGRRWYDPAWSPHGWVPIACGALIVAAIGALLPCGPRDSRRVAAGLAAVAYLSHWPADFLTGWKPTWPHGPMVGLRLYGRPMADLALEAIVVAAGWALWRTSLSTVSDDASHNRRRNLLAGALFAALLATQLAADVVMARPWRA